MTKRTIWHVDLKMYCTAYVVADTREEAEALIRSELLGSGLEVDEQPHGDPAISGAQFDSEDFPEVSISPAMTICDDQADGWQKGIVVAEEVELDDEEDGTEGQDRESYSDDQDRDNYT